MTRSSNVHQANESSTVFLCSPSTMWGAAVMLRPFGVTWPPSLSSQHPPEKGEIGCNVGLFIWGGNRHRKINSRHFGLNSKGRWSGERRQRISNPKLIPGQIQSLVLSKLGHVQARDRKQGDSVMGGIVCSQLCSPSGGYWVLWGEWTLNLHKKTWTQDTPEDVEATVFVLWVQSYWSPGWGLVSAPPPTQQEPGPHPDLILLHLCLVSWAEEGASSGREGRARRQQGCVCPSLSHGLFPLLWQAQPPGAAPSLRVWCNCKDTISPSGFLWQRLESTRNPVSICKHHYRRKGKLSSIILLTQSQMDR